MSAFITAEDYANRVYLANRADFEPIIYREVEAPKRVPVPPSPNAPKTGQSAQKGYAEPRLKWTPRCSVCNGTGWVYSLSGKADCPRCCG